MKLLEPDLGKGRTVTTDNYFTSLSLANRLLKCNTTLLGMINTKGRKRFSTQVYRSDGAVLTAYAPKTNKSVCVLSTMHQHVRISNDRKRKPIVAYMVRARKLRAGAGMRRQSKEHSFPLLVTTSTSFGRHHRGPVDGHIPQMVAESVLTVAYENGVNLFDTAEIYASGRAETVLGSIIKKKGWRRSSFVITTKIYWGGQAETERGLSRKHIIEGLRGSLSRLQMDYVDIVFANRTDINTPMEEVVRAMTFVINQGLAMYWGTSRWSAMEIMEAYSVARQFNLVPPVCEQAEYHYFQRDKVEVQLPELYHKIGNTDTRRLLL
ncbi:hypothetical protein SRHO_G00141400 [Serrasalmus rhombeus]